MDISEKFVWFYIYPMAGLYFYTKNYNWLIQKLGMDKKNMISDEGLEAFSLLSLVPILNIVLLILVWIGDLFILAGLGKER